MNNKSDQRDTRYSIKKSGIYLNVIIAILAALFSINTYAATDRTAQVRIVNNTGRDIPFVQLNHVYGDIYEDKGAWVGLDNGQTSSAVEVRYQTGFGTTSVDWWMITWSFDSSVGDPYIYKTNPNNFRSTIDAVESFLSAGINIYNYATTPQYELIISESLSLAGYNGHLPTLDGVGQSAKSFAKANAVGLALTVASSMLNAQETDGYKRHLLTSGDETGNGFVDITLKENGDVTISSPSGISDTVYTGKNMLADSDTDTESLPLGQSHSKGVKYLVNEGTGQYLQSNRLVTGSDELKISSENSCANGNPGNLDIRWSYSMENMVDGYASRWHLALQSNSFPQSQLYLDTNGNVREGAPDILKDVGINNLKLYAISVSNDQLVNPPSSTRTRRVIYNSNDEVLVADSQSNQPTFVSTQDAKVSGKWKNEAVWNFNSVTICSDDVVLSNIGSPQQCIANINGDAKLTPCHLLGRGNTGLKYHPKSTYGYPPDLDDNAYTIKDKDGLCLDVAGSNTANGSNVLFVQCHGGDNQKFLYNAAKQQVELLLDEDKCLDLDGGSTSSGTNVQVHDCNNTNAQKFALEYLHASYRQVDGAAKAIAVTLY